MEVMETSKSREIMVICAKNIKPPNITWMFLNLTKKTSRENKYVVSFVDWLTNWIEA